MTRETGHVPERRIRLSRAALRTLAPQALLVAAVALVGWSLIDTARHNLADQHIASGFGFLQQTAGFDVSQSLIAYSRSDTYGRVFLVGLANTLLISALGILLATVIGFAVGIARLSPSWVLARLAGAYVEITRNLPLLFQILFWYLLMLGVLPGPRQSLEGPLGLFLNNRGLILPQPVAGAGLEWVAAAAGGAVLAAILVGRWARARQARSGRSFPAGRVALLLMLGAPLAAFLLLGQPLALAPAELRGFNFIGGIRLVPEFVAVVAGLSFYTAGFIAEIVRAGIQAVDRGQAEAAASLGLRPGRTLQLVVIPQAMRVIVPPLTSQFLNVVKNSSLAMAVGFPDLVAVFAGTTLNQTGQAIEIIAMTMAVYLAISLLTALVMNLYNRRFQPVGR
ncbi:amino acid ABC transporter permease [Blastochloris sulfoviridis]|uniref:Amino acid ABC transporter permease n=1 Tax=Blastochloris sulfoviridis TaxID=50712 RepID=A0A5M6I2T9_9HYPH|nr:amino acid ABC transporter permease [Blastochloris sulfoviridis]KAA5602118.1 amino acid ABC transporter permease [Blastochloris sulfoviridis]